MGALDGVPGGVMCERAVGSDVPAVMRREALLVTSGPRKSSTTLAALVMSAMSHEVRFGEK